MEQYEICSTEIESQALLGERRCRNMSEYGTSVILADDDASHSVEELVGGSRMTYYVELLHRATEFFRFCEENVGRSSEFPVKITAENGRTMREFDEQFNRLKHVVDYLGEV